MKRFLPSVHLTISIFINFVFSNLASAQPPDWAALFDQSGGVHVFFGSDLEGPLPYERNSAVAFAPASNAKIFTATAAIESLGPNYTYPTLLEWEVIDGQTAGKVRLLGAGDPSWGISELSDSLRTRVDQIAVALSAQGIKQIQGDIEVSAGDARWEQLRYPEGWLAKDTTHCDGALAQAFNLNLNCGTFTVSSPATGQWAEQGLREPVRLAVKAGKTTNLSAALIDFATPAQGFIIRGTLKRGAHVTFRLPVFNVAHWVKNLLFISLAEHGIQIRPKRTGDLVEPSLQKQMLFQSPALAQILKAMLKNSINLVGESVFKTLGLHFGVAPQTDLVTSGEQVLHDYLLSVGMPQDFKLADGCGLSRTSHITPTTMLAFLDYARRLHDFSTLWEGLPIAGFDGTLRNRMKGTAAEKRLRAKTGTLDGVYNLSGYVPTDKDYIPFVMLTKTSVSQSAVARSAEDRVGAALASLVKADALPEVLGASSPFPYVPEHAGRDDQ